MSAAKIRISLLIPRSSSWNKEFARGTKSLFWNARDHDFFPTYLLRFSVVPDLLLLGVSRPR